ncbi:helix-turn-helix domain-containing protein [Lactobacillus gasseri]|uniref:helix-turn-helix domain-containing protein n=1 Tax=Lactobacillus gasseri TaxID=1596 RepID=UPI0021B2CC9D|nr:helix-turn-helix domain-containing protein [Lactobacillus gasseri]
MQNRLKKLRLEKRLTLADVQAKTNIDFKILENLEKGLENGKHYLQRGSMRKNCRSERDGYAFRSLLHGIY